MKFIEGMFIGIGVSLIGMMVGSMMFPSTKEEICDCLTKIPKDMEKDLSK